MNSSTSIHKSYDIIIVGAGTAGCVLANRLSSDSNLQILILEAGSNHNNDPRVKTPGRSGECLGNSGIDWQFTSEPQAGLNGRTISHPRGYLIGGSSAINSHAIVYPSKAWLDAWADFGNDGWSAEDMIPCYQKFHSLMEPEPDVKDRSRLYYHKGSGQAEGESAVQTSFPATVDSLSEAWIDTFDRLGYGPTENVLDGRRSVGGGISPCAVANGERSHAGVAYLEPVRQRSNLKILEDVLVERIILDASSLSCVVATGVQYLDMHGLSHVCKAEKEVILCAGAFQSPQILELSGIGRLELLNSLGIDVMVPNSFVGENLQDHLNCGPSFEVKEGISTSDDARNPDYVKQIEKEYELNKSGPLASSCYTFGYSSLQMFDSEADTQDLLGCVDSIQASADPGGKAFHLPSQELQDRFIRRMISNPNEATATMYMVPRQRNLDQNESKRKAILQPGSYISLIAMLSHPFSRGTVHINSTDPKVKPQVDFRYLSHPLDVEVFARHLFAFEKLVTCEPLASKLKPVGIRLPASFADKIDNVDKATKMLRQCAGTNYHPACACPMMSKELGGVVNDRLIVHGTTNLRVCDASVFPIIPRGNILSSVYAVAERGADIMKDDLKSRASQ